jgi:hypothetical protein
VSPYLVGLCYGSAFVLALFLLWYYGVKHWYWHLLSFVVALAIGLTPLPSQLNTVTGTLVVGWVFVVLFIWGVAAPIFALAHQSPHVGHWRPR